MLKEGCVVVCNGQYGILTKIVKTISQTNQEKNYYSGYWFHGEKFNDYQGVLFQNNNIEEFMKEQINKAVGLDTDKLVKSIDGLQTEIRQLRPPKSVNWGYYM